MAEQALINNEGQAVDITVDEAVGTTPPSQENPAAPSPVTSVAGAPVEPAPVQTAEPAVTTPDATPATTETAETSPPPATTTEEPAPATPAPSPETLVELAQWRDEAEDAAHRSAQSVYDKRAATQDANVEALTQSVQDMRLQLREREIEELETEEEKEEVRQRYVLADGNQVLNERQTELEGYHSFLLRESYGFEFSEYGVDPEVLEDFETPAEMEAFCYEAKAAHYEKIANGEVTPAVTAAAPVAAAPAATPAAPAANVPAAATAPADPAGGGGGEAQPEPNIGKGPAAMREALSALKPAIVK